LVRLTIARVWDREFPPGISNKEKQFSPFQLTEDSPSW
jgi:hypothetical protein